MTLREFEVSVFTALRRTSSVRGWRLIRRLSFDGKVLSNRRTPNVEGRRGKIAGGLLVSMLTRKIHAIPFVQTLFQKTGGQVNHNHQAQNNKQCILLSFEFSKQISHPLLRRGSK